MTTAHAIVRADAEEFLNAQPPGSLDLVFGSPPYELARDYLEGGKNLSIARKTDDWVEWMVRVHTAAQRACKGLVAFVVAGQTDEYRWSAGPALYMADLHRAGLNLRNPPVYKRVGIPGSGGPDWLRADYELIVCTTPPGRLPWSDNTAMGHPPKWAPGGEMSHRMSSGKRVNQWGAGKKSGGRARRRNGDRPEPGSPSHVHKSRKDKAGEPYTPPVLANPGNVIVTLHSLNLIDIIVYYAEHTQTSPGAILRDLRVALDTKTLFRWWSGIIAGVFQATILQSPVQGKGSIKGQPRQRRQGKRAEAGPDDHAASEVRNVREDEATPGTPQGREPDEQRPVKPASSLLVVSPQGSQEGGMLRAWLYESLCSDPVLHEALPAIQEVRRSVDEVLESSFGADASSNIVHCLVGGNQMGDRFAHANEAPFPESLARFFVLSFAPPGGRVCDPFSGSGTTAKVCKDNGRNFTGCDLRQSQVDLGLKRLANVTPPLF